MKETGPKVGCFAGSCDHRLTTMTLNAHTHTYHYPLFESGTKTVLRMIALCGKDRVHINNNNKIDLQ